MKRGTILLLVFSLMLFGFGALTASGEERFTSGDWEYSLDINGSAVITAYRGPAKHVDIPDELDGHRTIGIGKRAFYYAPDVTGVTIPEHIFYFEENPFTDCMHLKDIIVSPDNPVLEVVDGVLFNNTGGIRQLVCYPPDLPSAAYEIPDGVQSIGAGAFAFSWDLTDVAIPGSVREIGDQAFEGCFSLAHVTIAEGVERIGNDAFTSCRALTEITIPDSVTDMGNNPFNNCDGLREIRVSEEHPYLAVLDGVLFSKPWSILVCFPKRLRAESYEIPEGIWGIGGKAFMNCTSLKTVKIPSSVRCVFELAFGLCSSLTEVEIPEGVTEIGPSAFAGCGSLTRVVLPESVTSIGKGAFERCGSLTVTVPRGSYAEQYCRENEVNYTY